MARVELLNLKNLGKNIIKIACTGMAVVLISATPYVVKAENITATQSTYEVEMASPQETQNAYSAVFDAEYYAQNNPDVVEAVGSDEESLLWHFLNFGMQEGRQGNATFDVVFYKNSNGDLQEAFGDDLPSYYMHYVNFGQAEGRLGSSTSTSYYNGTDYSAVYDKEEYRELNPDVDAAFGDDTDALIAHFVNFGMGEGRQADKDFNVVDYRYGRSNEDLRAAYGADMKSYYLHYMNFGKNEGRSSKSGYEAVFNADYYLQQNKDVYDNIVSRFTSDGNTEGWALWHFVEYGMDEGRQGNEDFNVQNYEKKYSDVASTFGTDWRACYLHYINYGTKEGRNSIITPKRESGEDTELENAIMAYFPNSNNFNTFTMDDGYVHDISDMKAEFDDTCNSWTEYLSLTSTKDYLLNKIRKHYEYLVDGVDGSGGIHAGDVYMDRDTLFTGQYIISSDINNYNYISGSTTEDIAKSFYETYINNGKANRKEDTASTYVFVKALYDSENDQTNIYFVHGDVKRRIRVQESSTNTETTYYVYE